MSQLNNQSSKTTLELSIIQSLLNNEESHRVSPSKNYNIGAWLEAKQNLTHIYSKNIKSPTNQKSKSIVFKKHRPLPVIQLRKIQSKTSAQIHFDISPFNRSIDEPNDYSLTNFVFNNTQQNKNEYYDSFATTYFNRRKTPNSINSLKRKQKVKGMHAIQQKEKGILSYISDNIKPIGVKRYNYFDDVLTKEMTRNNKSNKVVKLMKMIKDKENLNYGTSYKRNNTSQDISHSFLL